MKRTVKELSEQAQGNGICDDWLGELKGLKTVGQLADMYLRGIDFCLSNDFPSNEFIRANFAGRMEKYGIYLDDTVNVRNRAKTVLLGACVALVEATDFQVSEVFVKHDGQLHLKASGRAFVMVDAFDNAVVRVDVNDQARVAVNKYGNARVEVVSLSKGGYLKETSKENQTY